MYIYDLCTMWTVLTTVSQKYACIRWHLYECSREPTSYGAGSYNTYLLFNFVRTCVVCSSWDIHARKCSNIASQCTLQLHIKLYNTHKVRIYIIPTSKSIIGATYTKWRETTGRSSATRRNIVSVTLNFAQNEIDTISNMQCTEPGWELVVA